MESTICVETAFRTQFDYVWSSLKRFGVRDADLDDVTHEVFVVVHRKRDQFDASRPLKPWLLGIAANAASDYRRKASCRRERIGDDVDARDASVPADERIDELRRRALLDRAIASIHASRAAVFVMHEIEGFSMPFIARELGISLNTGYSRLRLAREDFSAAIHRLRATQAGARSARSRRRSRGCD